MNLLIVVDMQKDFIDGSLGTAEAQAIVPAVKERIVEAMGDRWQVIFTKDTHSIDSPQDPGGQKPPGNALSAGQRRLAVPGRAPGSLGGQLHL